MLLLPACHRRGRVERPYAPPTAAELRDVLRARQESVKTMNARARATSWLGGDRIRATVLMLVDRAGRLRLEAEVSLQGTVAVLATDGNRFAFLDMQRNELRRGPACPANVASLIRIPLGPADVAAILLGDARLPSDQTAAGDDRVDWDGDAGADVLDLRAGTGRLRYLFQRKDASAGARDARLVGVSASDGAGHLVWRAVFEDFVDAAVGAPGAPRVPFATTVHYAEGAGALDEGLEIRFKEQSLNETLASESFSIIPPTGTKVVNVGCPKP